MQILICTDGKDIVIRKVASLDIKQFVRVKAR